MFQTTLGELREYHDWLEPAPELPDDTAVTVWRNGAVYMEDTDEPLLEGRGDPRWLDWLRRRAGLFIASEKEKKRKKKNANPGDI